MNHFAMLIGQGLVAAPAKPVWEMGSRFRHDPDRSILGDFLTILALVVAAAALGWALHRLIVKQDRFRRFNNPRRLFKQLCRAHRLNRASRRLLWRLARESQLAQPATVFLDPRLFGQKPLPPGLESQRRRIVRLGQQLFAQAPTAVATPGRSTAAAPGSKEPQQAARQLTSAAP